MHACIHSSLHTDIPADLQTYRVETTETWDISWVRLQNRSPQYPTMNDIEIKCGEPETRCFFCIIISHVHSIQEPPCGTAQPGDKCYEEGGIRVCLKMGYAYIPLCYGNFKRGKAVNSK